MNERQWWQCMAIATVAVVLSLASIARADEDSAKAAQLIADTAIKAAGEARAEAVERCHANGVQDPYTVAIFNYAEGLLTFGIGGTMSALDYWHIGNWHFERGNWAGSELAYIAAAVQADQAYDMFNLVYPDE